MTEQEAFAQGLADAHERLRTVLADPRAKGREVVAVRLAIKASDMSAEDVCSFVASMQQAAPPRSVAPSFDEPVITSLNADLCMAVPMPRYSANGDWQSTIDKLKKDKS